MRKICFILLLIPLLLVACASGDCDLRLNEDNMIVLSLSDSDSMIADAAALSYAWFDLSVYDALSSDLSYKQKQKSEAAAVLEYIFGADMRMRKTDISFDELSSGCEIQFGFYDGTTCNVYLTREGALYLLNGSDVYVSDKNAIDPTPYLGYMN